MVHIYVKFEETVFERTIPCDIFIVTLKNLSFCIKLNIEKFSNFASFKASVIKFSGECKSI
jgi:hypothetical protein